MRGWLFFAWVLFSCLSCKDGRTFICADGLEGAEWDFGSVRGDSVVGHVFELVNRTGERCVIREVVVSCGGCMEWTLAGDTLEVGGTTRLRVELDLRGVTGRFGRKVMLFTSLREEPYVLSLRASVPLSRGMAERKYRVRLCEGLRANVATVYVGNVYADGMVAREMEVVNVSERRRRLRMEVVGGGEYVEVEGLEWLEPLEPERVRVVYDGGRAGGRWGTESTRLRFAFGGDEGEVACAAWLVPFPLERSAERARMRVVENVFEEGRKRVRVKNVGNADLRVLEVRRVAGMEVVRIDSVVPPRGTGELVFTCDGGEVEVLTNDAVSPVVVL